MAEKFPKHFDKPATKPASSESDAVFSRRDFIKKTVAGGILLAMGESPVAEAAPGLEIKIHSSTAEISYDGNKIKLYKRNGAIAYQIIKKRRDSSVPAPVEEIDFQNKRGLVLKISPALDDAFGSGRPNMSNEVSRIFDAFFGTGENGDNREAGHGGQEVFQGKTFLDLDYGTYALDQESSDPPATYLLVENKNTGSLYCLSFVQVAFDMIYGSGSARKIGLYGNAWANDLKLQNEIDYDPSKHKNLPKGTIVRFEELGHVGISLGGDKVAHIIGDEFYIDHSNDITYPDYRPARIIIPDGSYAAKKIEICKISGGQKNLGRFERGRNIENVAYRTKQMITKRNETNLNYIREVIFQLNKDKFKVIHGNGNSDTIVVLKNNYAALDMPDEWLDPR
ncbi:MAG: hypothetical protein Q8L10_03095 [Candidatus Moranbacteria bacterium]|nr:hypothetical protein [Candidatus Moranbacteria bacterium]